MREDGMDKPFGVVVIALAMFITLGALAASSTKMGERTAYAENAAVGAGAAERLNVKPPSEPAAQADTATNPEVERGRYLVEEVAKCPECHTPRDAQGELRTDAWLSGAPVWIRPVAPIANWADHAPTLAGWPSFTEEQGERILEKGTGPEGEELRPPMHIYHMKHEDAKAIIAYLKSLPRSSQTH
jgi:mono/diheme cytochrome c family protein